MQSALLFLGKLRGAAAASAGTSLRAFTAVAEGAAEAKQWGAKNKLFRVLGSAGQPLSSAEIWEKVQGDELLKSKRFMKQMLQQLKQSGHVRTQRLVGSKRVKAFGYSLAGPRKAEPSPTS